MWRGSAANALECRGWDSADWLHDHLARSLSFPQGYGRNLDALNDVLDDLEYREEGGTALLFRGFDAFARREPRLAWSLLDILEGASPWHLLFGRRLIILLQSAAWPPSPISLPTSDWPEGADFEGLDDFMELYEWGEALAEWMWRTWIAEDGGRQKRLGLEWGPLTRRQRAIAIRTVETECHSRS